MGTESKKEFNQSFWENNNFFEFLELPYFCDRQKVLEAKNNKVNELNRFKNSISKELYESFILKIDEAVKVLTNPKLRKAHRVKFLGEMDKNKKEGLRKDLFHTKLKLLHPEISTNESLNANEDIKDTRVDFRENRTRNTQALELLEEGKLFVEQGAYQKAKRCLSIALSFDDSIEEIKILENEVTEKIWTDIEGQALLKIKGFRNSDQIDAAIEEAKLLLDKVPIGFTDSKRNTLLQLQNLYEEKEDFRRALIFAEKRGELGSDSKKDIEKVAYLVHQVKGIGAVKEYLEIKFKDKENPIKDGLIKEILAKIVNENE